MSDPEIYEFGRFRLEVREQRLTRDGEVVRLAPKALELLACFARHPGVALSKDQLLSELWPNSTVEEGNLAVHVSSLRRALDDSDGQRCIETLPKRGYRFDPPVRKITAAPEQEAANADVAPPPVSPRRWPIVAGAAVIAIAVVAGIGMWRVAEQPPLRSGPAYELYANARESWSRRTPDSVRSAIRMYDEAIRIDDRFALAYSGLADAYAITASGLPRETRAPLALAAAKRAIELDDSSAEAHTSLAFITYKFEWNWDLAERSFRRAIALDPDYALARHWYGEFLDILARYPEAVEQMRAAYRLDPSSPGVRSDAQSILSRAGFIDEARAIVDDSLRREPNSPRSHQALANVLTVQGRFDDAFEADARARMLSREPMERIDALRAAYQRGGRRAILEIQRDGLRAQLEKNEANLPFGLATNLAFNAVALEDWDEAVRWLEVAAERGEDGPLKINQLAVHEAMRTNPRLEALRRRVGLGR